MGQPPFILSISFYQSLLQTRHWILKRAGFNVVSTPDIREAIAQCALQHFDVVIIGHGILRKDQAALIAELRENPGTLVISLFSLGEPPVPEADYSLNSLEGPEKLIAIIKAALKKSARREAERQAKEHNQNSVA